LTALAVGDFDFDVGLLLEGPDGNTTLGAVELDILELREDTTSSSNNAAYTDKTVEMQLAQLSESVVHGQVKDAYVDVRVNTLIIRVMQKNHIHGDFIEELQNFRSRVCQEVGQDSFAFGQVFIGNLVRLGVELTESTDTTTVDGGARGVGVRREECFEFPLDCPLDWR
jgi:hypothetical protein